MLLHFAARSLVTGFAILAFSMPATAGEQTSQQFICHDGTAFSVAVGKEGADVTFSQSEHYRLRSKPFSIGKRFVSSTATLIIDGSFAAFVSSERIDLNQCKLEG